MSGYRVESLGKSHDRKAFVCGSVPLEHYFRELATQDMRRRLAFCFVAVADDGVVAGFYTLAATSVALDGLPAERVKQLPRYPSIPAVLLGRLAVATAHQSKGLGGALVADALLRVGRSEVTGHLMVVDAKDETAVRFYERLGFERLPDGAARLVRRL